MRLPGGGAGVVIGYLGDQPEVVRVDERRPLAETRQHFVLAGELLDSNPRPGRAAG